MAAAAAADDNNPNAGAIVIIGASNAGNYDSDNDDDADDSEKVDATNAASQPMEGIGDRTAIYRLIHDAIHKGTIDPILNENDKARRIKAAFTSPRLSHTMQRVASVIANKPAAPMPVLVIDHGLMAGNIAC